MQDTKNNRPEEGAQSYVDIGVIHARCLHLLMPTSLTLGTKAVVIAENHTTNEVAALGQDRWGLWLQVGMCRKRPFVGEITIPLCKEEQATAKELIATILEDADCRDAMHRAIQWALNDMTSVIKDFPCADWNSSVGRPGKKGKKPQNPSPLS